MFPLFKTSFIIGYIYIYIVIVLSLLVKGLKIIKGFGLAWGLVFFFINIYIIYIYTHKKNEKKQSLQISLNEM